MKVKGQEKKGMSNLGLSLASLGVIGATTNILLKAMFGGKKMFGNDEIEKKDLAKGVVGLVCESYEKEIDELNKTITELREELGKLEEERNQLKSDKTKARVKSKKK